MLPWLSWRWFFGMGIIPFFGAGLLADAFVHFRLDHLFDGIEELDAVVCGSQAFVLPRRHVVFLLFHTFILRGSTVVGMVIIFCKYRNRTREEALQNQSKFLQNRAIFTSAILAKSCIKRLEFLYIKESGRGKCKNVILWCFLCKDLVGIERFCIFGEKFTLS